jgi:hypothetical protein
MGRRSLAGGGIMRRELGGGAGMARRELGGGAGIAERELGGGIRRELGGAGGTAIGLRSLFGPGARRGIHVTARMVDRDEGGEGSWMSTRGVSSSTSKRGTELSGTAVGGTYARASSRPPATITFGGRAPRCGLRR